MHMVINIKSLTSTRLWKIGTIFNILDDVCVIGSPFCNGSALFLAAALAQRMTHLASSQTNTCWSFELGSLDLQKLQRFLSTWPNFVLYLNKVKGQLSDFLILMSKPKWEHYSRDKFSCWSLINVLKIKLIVSFRNLCLMFLSSLTALQWKSYLWQILSTGRQIPLYYNIINCFRLCYIILQNISSHTLIKWCLYQ